MNPQNANNAGIGDPAAQVSLSVVAPVFNEEEAIGSFLDRLFSTISWGHDIRLEVIFVNDGSTDNSLKTMIEAQQKWDNIRVIELSRNFGKEAALTAGILEAKGDIIIPIDVDLQDPPELIPAMIEKWRQGFDVVLARRCNRDTDSTLKRLTAKWFYKVHNSMAETRLPDNVGDFRLIDRRVVEALRDLPESRRFMKGLFAWLGFRTITIDYIRPERVAGTSKFNGWKLWNFALEGITSFSTTPLRVWTYLGMLVAIASFLFASFIAFRVFMLGVDVPGYASLMVAITFLGGIQLIGIGVLGEYLGRTYLESKRRPAYIIRKIHEVRPGNGP